MQFRAYYHLYTMHIWCYYHLHTMCGGWVGVEKYLSGTYLLRALMLWYLRRTCHGVMLPAMTFDHLEILRYLSLETWGLKSTRQYHWMKIILKELLGVVSIALLTLINNLEYTKHRFLWNITKKRVIIQITLVYFKTKAVKSEGVTSNLLTIKILHSRQLLTQMPW